MRNAILLIACFTLISGLALGQSENHTRLSFVLNPQVSWIKSDLKNVTSRGSMAGYNFGIVADHFFAENYALSTGLTINTTGGKLKYTPEAGASTIRDYHLRYIEVPLGLKLQTNEFRRSQLYGRFGLASQFNIRAKDGDDLSLTDEVRFIEFSYHLGAGLEYSLGGNNALMFGLLLNNGITDITKTTGYDDKAILNRLVFEVGFIF
jgi:hypothetical protein